jgi:hypothetical protein
MSCCWWSRRGQLPVTERRETDVPELRFEDGETDQA